ncbi:hypothetical protein MIND_01328300 [Mycena indigotica]|uniref:F-box domain-containing protein n=1 Tax=Mycena indigotica TaxID=2126181 RepID=A0A8H6S013_9AGAR|nr:uncharacterized protein MIND_01328300 [Mycena indigotica]KAF7290151.1 hypothetical protein MIND_01328300 [Mycena indigotica]
MEYEVPHASIAQLRHEVEEIGNTIDSLKSQLVELEAQREAILDKLSSVVYPVNSLPPEVLGRIFGAAASLTPAKAVNSLLLRITSVCRHWRDVAIVDPALWTILSYIPGPHGEQDQLFNYFVARSRGLPISFNLDGLAKVYYQPSFFGSCSQWKDATITLPSGAAFDVKSLDEVAALNLPQLEAITLSQVWVHIYASENYYQTFSNAPLLHTVSVSFSHLLPWLGFPLQQLRKLTIQNHSMSEDIRVLLCQLSSIEDLSIGPIDIPQIDNHGVELEEKLTLQSLTTLSLFGQGSSMILLRARLPRLSKLHLSDLHRFDVTTLTHPGTLRALTNLASLTITLKHERDRSQAALLLSPDVDLPLQHLTITLAPLWRETENNVVDMFSSPDFLPDLESLTLIVPVFISIMIRPFMLGINARVANTVSRGVHHKMKLKKFIVDVQKSPYALSDEESQELHTLQRKLEQMGDSMEGL